jgi:23S rRNA pseudouridine1911/1915/1917 synthase
MTIKLSVEQDINIRLDKFLSSQLTDITRSKVQKLIKSGCIDLNGKQVVDADRVVKLHDSITVTMPEPEPTHIVPRSMELEIVYEDDHLALINKAAGVTVHPGAGNHNDTLVNGLVHYFKNSLSKVGGELRPGIVHRLDKNTSGLLLVAKNDVVHAKLSEQLKNRDIKRTYLALVWGVPTSGGGTIDANIGRDRQNRKKMKVVASGGKSAVTHYQLLQTFLNGTFALLQCNLQTGRTHQIRVHLKHIGYPIVGDKEYGYTRKNRKQQLSDEINEQISLVSRQMLHAVQISFMHPITGHQIERKVDMPGDMKSLIKTLH